MWTRLTGVQKMLHGYNISEIHVVYLSNTYLSTKYTRVSFHNFVSVNRGWKLPLLKVMFRSPCRVLQVCFAPLQTRQFFYLYASGDKNPDLCFHFVTAFPNADLNSLSSSLLECQLHKIVLDKFRARAKRIKSILSLSSSSCAWKETSSFKTKRIWNKIK